MQLILVENAKTSIYSCTIFLILTGPPSPGAQVPSIPKGTEPVRPGQSVAPGAYGLPGMTLQMPAQPQPGIRILSLFLILVKDTILKSSSLLLLQLAEEPSLHYDVTWGTHTFHCELNF